MRKPSKWVYILALMPGLGQMCLGLMNRGLQLMLLFWGGIFFASIGIPVIMVFTPVLVFYSYFDALQSYRKKADGEQVWDEPLIDWELIFQGNYGFNGIKKNWIGWGLILLGLFVLFNTVTSGLINYFGMEFLIHFPFEELILIVVLIWLGIRLLRGDNSSTVKAKQNSPSKNQNVHDSAEETILIMGTRQETVAPAQNKNDSEDQ